MKVGFEGLVKILYRRWGWLYSKDKIKELIEAEGANYIDSRVTYLGFGVWEIAR